MWKSGRGFGKVGALYAGTECVIESVSGTIHSGRPSGAYVPRAFSELGLTAVIS